MFCFHLTHEELRRDFSEVPHTGNEHRNDGRVAPLQIENNLGTPKRNTRGERNKEIRQIGTTQEKPVQHISHL